VEFEGVDRGLGSSLSPNELVRRDSMLLENVMPIFYYTRDRLENVVNS
jgi:hypothetical protein